MELFHSFRSQACEFTDQVRLEGMAQISNFIEMQSSSFSSNDVRSFLGNKLNSDYSQKSIIEFMKGVFGLSYKKLSARLVTREFDKISTFKALF